MKWLPVVGEGMSSPTLNTPTLHYQEGNTGNISVAMAQADIFAILGNKIVINLKIFMEVDYLRS